LVGRRKTGKRRTADSAARLPDQLLGGAREEDFSRKKAQKAQNILTRVNCRAEAGLPIFTDFYRLPALEHFHKSGSVAESDPWQRSFWFWTSFRLSCRVFKPAPSPKPRPQPKILAPPRYIISVNALLSISHQL